MNTPHLHLIVNHLPILFPVVGISVMLCAWIFKADILKRMAYGIFILSALATIAAVTSGEGAEETLEHMAGIDERYMHAHEEKAEIFAVLIYILGAAGLLGIFLNLKKFSFERMYAIGVTLFAVVCMFFAQQTATTGGEIRHSEIRKDQILLPAGNPGELDDDD